MMEDIHRLLKFKLNDKKTQLSFSTDLMMA